MEFKIDLKLPNIADLCPCCWGTGKLKAMQRAMTYNGESVRTADTTVKCTHCNGKGFIKK